MLIPTAQNTKTVTDLRENTIKLLKEVEKQGHLYIFQHSDPKAVMMSIDEFVHLQELLEDYLDEFDAMELKRESPGEEIPFEKIAKKYAKSKRV